MTFGEYLRELRTKKEISLLRLSDVTGYDRKQLRDYENKSTYVPTNEKIVFDLSDALDLTDEEEQKLMDLAFGPRIKALEESFPRSMSKVISG